VRERLFVKFNKEYSYGSQSLHIHKFSSNPSAIIDNVFKDLHELPSDQLQELKACEQNTAFNRQQIFDFYTKFKALSKMSMQRNRAQYGVSFEPRLKNHRQKV